MKTSVDIALLGYGRMGKRIEELAASDSAYAISLILDEVNNKNGEGLKTANIDREIRAFWAPPVWSLKLVRPMYDRSAYTFYQTIYP